MTDTNAMQIVKLVEEYCNRKINVLEGLVKVAEVKKDAEYASMVGQQIAYLDVQLFLANFMREQLKEAEKYDEWLGTA